MWYRTKWDRMELFHGTVPWNCSTARTNQFADTPSPRPLTAPPIPRLRYHKWLFSWGRQKNRTKVLSSLTTPSSSDACVLYTAAWSCISFCSLRRSSATGVGPSAKRILSKEEMLFSVSDLGASATFQIPRPLIGSVRRLVGRPIH